MIDFSRRIETEIGDPRKEIIARDALVAGLKLLADLAVPYVAVENQRERISERRLMLRNRCGGALISLDKEPLPDAHPEIQAQLRSAVESDGLESHESALRLREVVAHTVESYDARVPNPTRGIRHNPSAMGTLREILKLLDDPLPESVDTPNLNRFSFIERLGNFEGSRRQGMFNGRAIARELMGQPESGRTILAEVERDDPDRPLEPENPEGEPSP
jgi:hypothetical protein